jgi:tRNA pseudouridine38-40 synthase
LTLFDPEPGTGDAGAGVGPVDLAPPPEMVAAADPARPAEPAPPAQPAPATVRLRLSVAYDGSGFRGFAAQPGQDTVAGALADAIATVARHPVTLTCAGRTDAGVHARGQVVHVDVEAGVDPVSLSKAVNAMLAPRIVVRRAEAVADSFDARRHARSRRYRYLVLESEAPDPLLAPFVWHVKDRLELRAMMAAADALLGEHDFRAFCRRPPGSGPEEPIVRRVLDARWDVVRGAAGAVGEGARLLRFGIEAQSFCHQMVRSIVGTLVDVGRGRHRAADVVWFLSSAQRAHGSNIAPPHGLCLMSVDYGEGGGRARP